MSPDLPAQFNTSPYADSFVKVLLKGKTITWIHRGVVPGHVLSSKSTYELGSKSASPILDLQYIGSDTAHVILDFFYTKQYACIKPSGVPGATGKGYELRVSLQVIEAARKMALFDLVKLAKTECARLCHEMDLLNLVAILGKMNIDCDNFPELTNHIAFHLEKVLADPYSILAYDLLNRATSNSITDMLIRKLVMVARDEPASEPKVKLRRWNEARDVPIKASELHLSMADTPSQFPCSSLESQRIFRELSEVSLPDNKGKGRDVSRPAENPSEVPGRKVSNHEPRGAKGQKEAQSGPSRVRGWPCPFSPPCGGCADAETKTNPPTPKLETTIASMKDFVVAEKSSAVDWEVPKSEAEKSETSNSDPESTIVVVSDDEGVLVESEETQTCYW